MIMPDARGHGNSASPPVGYRYEDLASDVVGLAMAMKLTSPFLLGHSMGGLTAAVVASRKPNLLRGLILSDPTFLSPDFQREVFESDAVEQHLRMLTMSLDEIVKEARARHPDRLLELLGLIARARLQTNTKAFNILTPPNPDYMDLIRAIDVRTLLVTGDAGVVSSAVAGELKRINSRLQVEQISKAGHGIHYDQPDKFAAVVKSFLSSVPIVNES